MAERISVALATYNGGEFLEEQLASVAAQTRLPDELVVSDDGSQDDTLAIAERFATAAPFPVKIHRSEERLGYRGNFRRAVGLCTGSLIAYCDQDDVWAPEKLARIAPAFNDPAVQLAYHNAHVTDGRRNRLRLKLDAAEERQSLSQQPLDPFKFSYGLLQTFRSDLRRFDHLWGDSVDQNDPAEALAHDQWFFFLAQILGRIEFLDEPLLDYRQHGSNTFGIATRRSRWSKLQERLKHNGHRDEWKARSAKSRAHVAREIAAMEPARKAHLTMIAEAYDTYAARLMRRCEVYSARSGVRRAASLISSATAGDYGQLPWKFDSRSIVRDLWSGVVKGTA